MLHVRCQGAEQRLMQELDRGELCLKKKQDKKNLTIAKDSHPKYLGKVLSVGPRISVDL